MIQQTVHSWEQLQEQIEAILDRLHANPNLTMAAAVNPLLALEEIGYDVDPEARPLIEERLRFEPRVVVRRQQLREEIYAQAGRPVDLASAEDLRVLLFDELKLSPPETPQQKEYEPRAAAPIDTRPLPPQLSYRPQVTDPLEQLRGAHPVIEPLLEYRRLEARAPLLAPRHVYDRVRQGKLQLPFSRIRARLKARPPAPPQPSPAPAPTPTPSPAPGAPLNINSASATELARLPGIGPRLAERIVDYRLAFGPFETIDSLTGVSGIGQALVERLRPYIAV